MKPSPHLSAAGALCAVAVALAACAGGDVVDPAAAAVLADRADRLADHLDADAGCEALTEADMLLAMTADAVDDGAIAANIGTEVEAVVADITAEVRCEAVEDPDPDTSRSDDADGSDRAGEPGAPARAEDRDDDRDAAEGKGQGNGKGHDKGKGEGKGQGKGQGKGRS